MSNDSSPLVEFHQALAVYTAWAEHRRGTMIEEELPVITAALEVLGRHLGTEYRDALRRAVREAMEPQGEHTA